MRMHPDDALAYEVSKREREAADAGKVRARVHGMLVAERGYEDDVARRLADAALRGFYEGQRAEATREREAA